MDDYVRRLGIHIAAPLPCAARSLTPDEARAVDRRRIVWMVGVLVFFTLLYGGILSQAGAEPQVWRIMGLCLAGLALFVAILSWLRLRKRRDYRDPGLVIEAGADELIVRGPAGRDARPYADVAVRDLLSTATKSGRSFDGILLDTKLGALRIEDEHFMNGRIAAGAILKRLDELGVPLRTDWRGKGAPDGQPLSLKPVQSPLRTRR